VLQRLLTGDPPPPTYDSIDGIDGIDGKFLHAWVYKIRAALHY
jgi:hypothetical protein